MLNIEGIIFVWFKIFNCFDFVKNVMNIVSLSVVLEFFMIINEFWNLFVNGMFVFCIFNVIFDNIIGVKNEFIIFVLWIFMIYKVWIKK